MAKTHLRKLTHNDFDVVFRWENTEELWAVSDETGPFSEDDIRLFMERCLSADTKEIERWMIIDEDELPIGAIDLFHIDELLKTASIGIFIAEAQNRKKGHASSALKLFLSQLQQRKWNFIKALIHLDNNASIRLFNSIGFTPGGEQLHRGKKARQFVYCLPANLEMTI